MQVPAGLVSGEGSLLGYNGHLLIVLTMPFSVLVRRERELSSSSYKAANSIVRAPSSLPNLTLNCAS